MFNERISARLSYIVYFFRLLILKFCSFHTQKEFKLKHPKVWWGQGCVIYEWSNLLSLQDTAIFCDFSENSN